jgi:hypothetical protein
MKQVFSYHLFPDLPLLVMVSKTSLRARLDLFILDELNLFYELSYLIWNLIFQNFPKV